MPHSGMAGTARSPDLNSGCSGTTGGYGAGGARSRAEGQGAGQREAGAGRNSTRKHCATASFPKIKPLRPTRPRLGTVSLRNTVQEPKTTGKEFQTWSPSL